MSALRAFRALCKIRSYSTGPPKVPVKLVAELRKLTEVSLVKAREALAATNNDVQAALTWLEQDLATSGAKKAAKVEGRQANEGLVCISTLSNGSNGKQHSGGVRAAIVELNCETDFVGRNQLFGKLAADIAHTAAFISEPMDAETIIRPMSLDLLHDAPLITSNDPASRSSSTVFTSIRDLITRVGEKVSLRRVSTITTNPIPSATLGLRLGSYTHGSLGLSSQGRIGTLALLALNSPTLSQLFANEVLVQDLGKLERSIARQIAGFDTRTIRPSPDTPEETALYNQPFMMLAGNTGESVETALRTWANQRITTEGGIQGGVEVIEYAKWTVGEPL